METFLIIVGTLILVALIYFNTVATIILFKTPDSAALMNFFRTLFVWLVPVIGFAVLLRISQQTFDCPLHDKLVPKFVARWIYDERDHPRNPNADRNYEQATRFGAAEMSKEFRDKN